jgi:hypothetical protein
MSATAPKTDAKTKEAKTKKASPARIKANRRNAQQSCGPKTDDGKARSRFNALKHGMTAETVLLPGDDGQAFANRLRYLQADLQPRNSLEGVSRSRMRRTRSSGASICCGCRPGRSRLGCMRERPRAPWPNSRWPTRPAIPTIRRGCS